MAGLLATEVVAVLAHRLEDVAVAHSGAAEGNAVLAQVQLQAQAAHYGCDEGVLCELAFALSGNSQDSHNLVTVYQIALFVNCLATVRVAVVGDAEVRAVLNDCCLQLLGVGGPHAVVDVGAVGLYSQCDNLCTQRFESCGRCCVCRTVCAVQNNLHASKGLAFRQSGDQVLNVSLGTILQGLDGTHSATGRVAEGLLAVNALNGVLNGVFQLLATSGQELNAVVRCGVVRCRNHHAEVSTGVCHQVSCRGGGDNAGVQHVNTCASEASLHRRNNKVCRGSGVICNHGTGAYTLSYRVKAQHNRSRLCEPHSQSGSNYIVCQTAYAVGSKKSFSHPFILRCA